MATQTVTMPQYEPDRQDQEAQPGSYELSFKTPGRTLKELSRRVAHASKSRDSSEEEDDIRNDVPAPATAQPVQQRWNKPKGNIGRLGFAFFSFIIAGMNDAAVGVCLPSRYIQTHTDSRLGPHPIISDILRSQLHYCLPYIFDAFRRLLCRCLCQRQHPYKVRSARHRHRRSPLPHNHLRRALRPPTLPSPHRRQRPLRLRQRPHRRRLLRLGRRHGQPQRRPRMHAFLLQHWGPARAPHRH